MKNKVKFCWECSRKLRGNYFSKIFFKGAYRIVHKTCAKHIGKESYENTSAIGIYGDEPNHHECMGWIKPTRFLKKIEGLE